MSSTHAVPVKSLQSVRGEPVEPQPKRIENIDPSTSSGRTGYVKLFMRHYISVSSESMAGMTSSYLTLALKEQMPQGIDGQECAWWEQITDYTKQQVRKGLTSPEESRNGIRCAWMTDDGLQCGAKALPAR